MTMKTRCLHWLILLFLVSAVAAQERPVRGYFADGRGALRALTGAPGAWESPVIIPDGILSAGFDGRLLWYKTATDLTLCSEATGCLSLPAPGGPAFAKKAEGESEVWFYFSSVRQRARFDSQTQSLQYEELEELPEPGPEEIGPGVHAVWRDDGIHALSEDGSATLVPLAEVPSFQLFFRDGVNEVAVGESFAMPPAAPGESSTARFRVRNRGTIAVVITRLSIDPGPFTTFDQFFPPRTIAPGEFADFSVRFAPTAPGEYARTLHVNDLKVTLFGASVASSNVEIETSSGWLWLKAGEKVSLGAVERRSVLTRRIRITPAAPASVTGDGFQLLPTADPSVFELRFQSDRVGLAAGTLRVEERQFPLEVQVNDFPAPTPSFVWSGTPGPARQLSFRIRLAEAARAAVTGALTVTFTPDSGLPDDAAVMLLPISARSQPVPFAEGASESGELTLQTGSTAGTIRVRIVIGSKSAEETIRIPATPVVLTQARAAVASANAQVTLTGFDTARTASRLSFTFYLKSGQPASPGRIDVDVRNAFAEYYRTVSGSVFSLRAHFPVSGTHTELDSVEVEIVNGSGATTTGRLRFE
jgi:hypothetical protein